MMAVKQLSYADARMRRASSERAPRLRGVRCAAGRVRKDTDVEPSPSPARPGLIMAELAPAPAASPCATAPASEIADPETVDASNADSSVAACELSAGASCSGGGGRLFSA